jgi:hypothetical protein
MVVVANDVFVLVLARYAVTVIYCVKVAVLVFGILVYYFSNYWKYYFAVFFNVVRIIIKYR